jgi:hypothetical protein
MLTTENTNSTINPPGRISIMEKTKTITLDHATRLIVKEGKPIEIYPKGAILELGVQDANEVIHNNFAHESTEQEIKEAAAKKKEK